MFRTFGSLYSRGNYHVFFEHFPFGLYSSRRYIAHSTSEDLLLWHNDPIAIYPTKKEDEDGAYEGSAIADEKGEIDLYYVGINYLKRDPEDLNTYLADSPLKTNLMSIRSTSGSFGDCFDNVHGKDLILTDEQAQKLGFESGSLRDPEVYRIDNSNRLLTFIGKTKEGCCLAFMAGRKGKESKWTWELRGIKPFPKGMAVRTIRFFASGDKSLVVFESNLPKYKIGRGDLPAYHCSLSFGALDFKDFSFAIDEKAVVPLDYGFDIRAPKVAYDTRNLPYIVGSMIMAHDIKGERGLISLPRRVQIDESGHIVQEIHPLIAKRLIYKSTDFKIKQTHFPILAQATFKEGSYLKLGNLSIYLTDSLLHVDRRKAMDKTSGHTRIEITGLPVKGSKVLVKAFLDQDICEVEAEGLVASFITFDTSNIVKADGLEGLSLYTVNPTKS